MSRKLKRELKNLQAGVKYHKFIMPKKQSLMMKERQLEHKKKKRMIFILIPDLLSCPTHLCGILAPKKVVEKDKSKKKLPSCIYHDFHAHLVGTNLKTQESDMYEKMKQLLPFIYIKETYRHCKYSDFISMKTMKDMESSTN